MWIVYLRNRVTNEREVIGHYRNGETAKQEADQVRSAAGSSWTEAPSPKPSTENYYQRQLTYDLDIVIERSYAPEEALDAEALRVFGLTTSPASGASRPAGAGG